MGNQGYEGGGTAIGTAIEAATYTLLGLPGREDRAQMMVVMTDGYDTESSDPAGKADIARAAGITVYVVAVDVGGTKNPNTGCYWSALLPSCIDLPTMELTAGDLARLFVVETFSGTARFNLQFVASTSSCSWGPFVQPLYQRCASFLHATSGSKFVVGVLIRSVHTRKTDIITKLRTDNRVR